MTTFFPAMPHRTGSAIKRPSAGVRSAILAMFGIFRWRRRWMTRLTDISKAQVTDMIFYPDRTVMVFDDGREETIERDGIVYVQEVEQQN